MKIFVMTLLTTMFGSAAMAYCPQPFPPGRIFNAAKKNYDGTCTILQPRLVDRGVEKKVAGDVDLVCAALGFGDRSGVDFETSLPVDTDTLVFGKQAPKAILFNITCRMRETLMAPPTAPKFP